MWPLECTKGKNLTTNNGHSTITIPHSEHAKKGHPRNNSVRLFQNLISGEESLRISSCPYSTGSNMMLANSQNEG